MTGHCAHALKPVLSICPKSSLNARSCSLFGRPFALTACYCSPPAKSRFLATVSKGTFFRMKAKASIQLELDADRKRAEYSSTDRPTSYLLISFSLFCTRSFPSLLTTWGLHVLLILSCHSILTETGTDGEQCHLPN